MKTMIMRRAFLPLVTLLVGCLCALSACGPSVENMIREDLAAQFDAVKAGGDDFVAAATESAGESFTTLGVDPAAFVDAYLDGFDYTINEVTVDGSMATADVTVTCKSMNDVMTSFQTSFAAALNEIDPASPPAEDELYRTAGQLLLEAAQSAEPKETTCSLSYTEDSEGVWTADGDFQTQLLSALMA